MYKIEKENLEALFRKIAESQDLILPIKKAGQTNFGLWNEGEEADIETLKTVKSGMRRSRCSLAAQRSWG